VKLRLGLLNYNVGAIFIVQSEILYEED